MRSAAALLSLAIIVAGPSDSLGQQKKAAKAEKASQDVSLGRFRITQVLSNQAGPLDIGRTFDTNGGPLLVMFSGTGFALGTGEHEVAVKVEVDNVECEFSLGAVPRRAFHRRGTSSDVERRRS